MHNNYILDFKFYFKDVFRILYKLLVFKLSQSTIQFKLNILLSIDNLLIDIKKLLIINLIKKNFSFFFYFLRF